MRRTLLWFALFLASCLHQPLVNEPLPSSRWAFETMHLVLPANSPECLSVSAIEAWKLLSPGVQLHVYEHGDGAPVPELEGLVTVAFEQPPLEGTAALSLMRKREGLIRNGHIWIPRCDVRLFAHELGHQLGLLDVVHEGRVMNYVVPGIGWTFSPEERAHLSASPLASAKNP